MKKMTLKSFNNALQRDLKAETKAEEAKQKLRMFSIYVSKVQLNENFNYRGVFDIDNGEVVQQNDDKDAIKDGSNYYEYNINCQIHTKNQN